MWLRTRLRPRYASILGAQVEDLVDVRLRHEQEAGLALRQNVAAKRAEGPLDALELPVDEGQVFVVGDHGAILMIPFRSPAGKLNGARHFGPTCWKNSRMLVSSGDPARTAKTSNP